VLSQIACAFKNASPSHCLLKPPSGGFPEGLLDRAFTPGFGATDPKARFNGLKDEGFSPLGIDVATF
jgi:hypothetical protein